MTRYIAFLRAINVGGRVVKMDDLKKMLALPGIKNINTYIQSGNVIFDSTSADIQALKQKIEKKLLATLGYEVATIIKTIPDIERVIKNNPFKKYPEEMGLHVSFLAGAADAALVQQLLTLQNENEQFNVLGTEAYILVRKGAYGETKFSNTFLEKKLKVQATTRNWATVNKMLEYRQDK